jgi:hypothetical protein
VRAADVARTFTMFYDEDEFRLQALQWRDWRAGIMTAVIRRGERTWREAGIALQRSWLLADMELQAIYEDPAIISVCGERCIQGAPPGWQPHIVSMCYKLAQKSERPELSSASQKLLHGCMRLSVTLNGSGCTASWIAWRDELQMAKDLCDHTCQKCAAFGSSTEGRKSPATVGFGLNGAKVLCSACAAHEKQCWQEGFPAD